MQAPKEIIQNVATEILNNSSSLSDFELVLIGFVLAVLFVGGTIIYVYKNKGK